MGAVQALTQQQSATDSFQVTASDSHGNSTTTPFTVVVAGGPRLADVLHGTAGSALGPRTAVAGGGILVVVVMLALAAAIPALRRYRI